jgi:hypothetical protein
MVCDDPSATHSGNASVAPARSAWPYQKCEKRPTKIMIGIGIPSSHRSNERMIDSVVRGCASQLGNVGDLPALATIYYMTRSR